MTALSGSDTIETTLAALARLKERRPRVHCLVNAVAPQLTATLLLAVGARPSITENPHEIEDFLKDSEALHINLGTLSPQRGEAAERAVATAGRAGIPWGLDPVKVDRSPHRAAFAQRLLAEGPAVVRCTDAEAATLGFAPSARTVRLHSGPRPVVEGAGQSVRIGTGHDLVVQVAGLGGASSALTAAFLSVVETPFDAAVCGALTFGVAARLAGGAAAGPGDFQGKILDALYGLTETQVRHNAEVRHDEAI